MEAFYHYFLSVLVVFISISLAFLCHGSESKKYKLPPGASRFPLVGETLHFFLSGPEKFIHHRMKKYSDEVFATSLIGQNMAVICGAAGNKFLLCTANDFVSPWLPAVQSRFSNWVVSLGKSRKDVHTKIHGFHQAVIMSPEALKQYIPIMDSLTRQHLQTDWDPFHVVKVHPASQKITLILACKLLLGLEPDQAQRFSDSFTVSLQAFYSLPINLPGTAYNRALKEVDKLKQEFLKIILERKKMVLENREKAGSDVLSRTLLDENAHLLSDLEFAVYLVSLMIPTYESGSASITFVLKHLAELPHIYDMVYKGILRAGDKKFFISSIIRYEIYYTSRIFQDYSISPCVVCSERTVSYKVADDLLKSCRYKLVLSRHKLEELSRIYIYWSLGILIALLSPDLISHALVYILLKEAN